MRYQYLRRPGLVWPLLVLLAACSGGSAGGSGEGSIGSGGSASSSSTGTRGIPDVVGDETAGADVEVALDLPQLSELNAAVAEAGGQTADDLREAYPTSFADALGYDPLAAENLELLFETLGDTEGLQTRLAEHGFAISAQSTYPSFAYGYSTLYAMDAPVYISADMILEALYRSHDKLFQSLEKQVLLPRLRELLTAVRRALAARVDSLSVQTVSDLNFYLGVALSLLNGGQVAHDEPNGVQSFVEAAMAAAGEQERVLFGVKRAMDFSQFKPRGHYAGDPELESYFRAMIWLGRMDFRLIETQPDGTQVLRRQQVEAMLALRHLLDDDAYAHYLAIDHAISAFVGEHDNMTLQDVDRWEQDLGSPASLNAINDETLATTLVEGHYGEQRIASHVMRRSPGSDTFPLNVSFALFGQRYTVDSHVLSNVVYDRVATRVVPSPLDVAFAALGNNQALGLLGTELDEEPGFSGQLATTRLLVDEHTEDYWHSSFYTSWLSALRSLSPALGEPPEDLPSVARTDAWGRRLLNTQLSSWAQLRHNNVLYVKQSYTSDAACEYPDAYVEPYPEFFRSVVALAERGQALAGELELPDTLAASIRTYFTRVAEINGTLRDMAELQRTGMPHSEEHLAFINRAVVANVNCDGTVLGHTGWYSELYFDPLEAVEEDPIIVDVHTDIGGELPVARDPSVLHVGTGLPRLMIVTVATCQGPRAYAGVVSTFRQSLQEGLTRLTDDEWTELLYSDPPPDPAWMTPTLAE